MLLMDEDTAETNFMIRDRRMQQLISKDKEPITPLLIRLDNFVFMMLPILISITKVLTVFKNTSVY